MSQILEKNNFPTTYFNNEVKKNRRNGRRQVGRAKKKELTAMLTLIYFL